MATKRDRELVLDRRRRCAEQLTLAVEDLALLEDAVADKNWREVTRLTVSAVSHLRVIHEAAAATVDQFRTGAGASNFRRG